MSADKEVFVSYVGHVAPFEPVFYDQPGYGRPGSFAQLGFIEALHNTRMGLDHAWGFRPIAHWPRAKIQFEWVRRTKLPCGASLTLLPLVNHFFLREISRFFTLAWLVVYWAIQRLGKKRILIMYNLTQPNGLVWMRLITWLTHTKLVPVIYDLDQISTCKKSLLFRMVEPDWLDRIHERLIPYCDGLLPITDAIPRDFAPKMDYLRIDGGIGEAVADGLPALEKKDDGEFVIFYAGGVEPWNGIALLLEYMRMNLDADLRLWIAGGGHDVPLVESAAKSDSRITYFGFLGLDKLRDLYARCDMLVSLRDLTDPGVVYHYPSKTFEMLAMGKPLLITNSSHTKEMYGEYCKVIDKCDLESYSAGVMYFRNMTAEDRLDFGRRAREFILRNRRWNAWGPALEKYLETIA